MAKNKKKGSKSQGLESQNSFEDNSVQKIPNKQKEPVGQNDEEVRKEHDTEDINGHESNVDGLDPKEALESAKYSSGQIEALKKQVRELKSELEKKEQNGKNGSESEIDIVRAERDKFENQYNNLLSRISSMKNVFNKIKESQNELETVQEQLTEYETQNLKLKQKLDSISKEKSELESTVVTLNKEFSSIEKEREEVYQESQTYKKTLEDLQNQVETFETSHSRELDFQRNQKSQLDTQLQELMLLLNNNKQDISALREEKEDLTSSLETTEKENSILKDSLKEMESELEVVEQQYNNRLSEKDNDINSLKAELEKSDETVKTYTQTVETLQKEIETMKDSVEKKEILQKECKDRVLQIGKLRHEAIILNEHLTKALAMLKQSSDSESVDKELISNLLISFVAIPRADPRKFEVLELISSFLNWDDDKKKQAGLILNTQNSGRSKTGSRTENFVSMWTNYLEKESE